MLRKLYWKFWGKYRFDKKAYLIDCYRNEQMSKWFFLTLVQKMIDDKGENENLQKLRKV